MKVLVAVCVSLIVISLIFIGISNAKINPKAIVGMWLFDKGTGTIAKDSSLNGNSGELMNGPKWVKGKFGMALEFDGVDDYVDVGSSSDFNLSTDKSFSFSLWINISEKGSHNGLICSYDGTDGYQFFKDCRPGNEDFAIWGDKPEDRIKYILKAEAWYHVALTRTGSDAPVLYVNGVSQGTFSSNKDFNNDGNSVYIGADVRPAIHFNGLIDEVAIFSVALTLDDIKSIMTKGLVSASAVSPAGKLAATLGRIKSGE